jgi:HemY protein
VFHAVIATALLLAVTMLIWSIIRHLWQSPANIGSFFLKRRNKRGLESLSNGMIAIGAGDRALATRHAIQARKALPNEPLTHLLRAQAAQLSGDRTTARRIFDAMLAAPETEQLGLRGLFLEAEREGEGEAARQYAERALALNPKLGWSADALFDLQCKQADWPAALETLSLAKRHGHIEKPIADRRRAVLLTAQAQAAEDTDPDRTMALAIEAQSLAPDLIPAAGIAGRLLSSRGQTAKAAKIIQKTWRRAPHPDLATAYAYARIGDSPRDRLTRIRALAELNVHSIESPIALATAAIEAKAWDEARLALAPLLEQRLTQRVCTLMAKIEGGEHGDAGRVREWLARAVNAPRDPAWTADGVVSETWSPVSPVTGHLDAFQWRVPVEHAEPRDQAAILGKLEELVALGARSEPVVAKNAAPARVAVDADIVEITERPSRTPARPVLPAATPAPIKVAQPQIKSPIVAESVVTGPVAVEPAVERPVSARATVVAPTSSASSVALAPVQPTAVATLQPTHAADQPKPLTDGVLRPVRGSGAGPISSPVTSPGTGPRTSQVTGQVTGPVTSPVRVSPAGQSNVNGGATSGTAHHTKAGPHIYVAPHAPDDPGLDTADDDAPARPYMVPYARPIKRRN